MMMSHFFLGFAEGLEGCRRAGPVELAQALSCASDSLYQAVDKPKEGTILTVVRESVEVVRQGSRKILDLGPLARQMLSAAGESLERTPDLLPALREASVVDAGGKGFVRFMEGVVSLIDGMAHPTRGPAGVTLDIVDAAALAEFPDDEERAFRYCSEFVVRAEPPPERRILADAVRGFGGSLIVTRAHTVAKIHIHTDGPDRVEAALARLGVEVECVKAEDMYAQHRRRRTAKSIALITDSTCDLPPEKIIEHDVTIVPLTVMFGDQAFLDQVDITHEEFIHRLTDPSQPPPTTSQPAPAQMERSFARAAEQADAVLGIFVAGALSGTLGQAQTVAGRLKDATVRVYDSRSASLGLGLQVLSAAELARQGRGLDEIVAELDRLRGRSGLLLTVDTLRYLRRSGRLGKARAFLGSLLDLKPVLSVDEEGTMIPVDRVRGREALRPRVIDLLKERVPRVRSRLRMGVAHVDCRQVADEIADALRREFQPDEVLVAPAAGVLAAHTGPGAWAVFYQAE